uniref:Large ribosomal subunit protein mL49 n=1 Tax=Gasterosteus aculeatus TaxID=69293 RepID=G3PIC9_GASAC
LRCEGQQRAADLQPPAGSCRRWRLSAPRIPLSSAGPSGFTSGLRDLLPRLSASDAPPPLAYTVRRSRMHNIPVYSDTTHGSRRTTLVRKVEGDIWALERDVKQHLKEVMGTEPPTQVNEVTMTLKVKGHVDSELKEWLASKGF